ncbi:MAG: tetratricopeptide repeat protein [Polyangiaceae bacterium]|nr:tetratricopeptide repeat protein [Polyangiaceae bacterium]
MTIRPFLPACRFDLLFLRGRGLLSLLGLAGCLGSCLSSAKKEGLRNAAATHAASSLEEQEELTALEDRWAVSSRAERLAMRSDLESYISTYPQTRSRERADLMLAWIAIEEGRLGAARRQLEELAARAKGRVLDDVKVESARLYRKQGQPQQALNILEPMRGKYLSESSRLLAERELVLSALEAKQYSLAVDGMRDWLVEGRQVNAAAAGEVPGFLARVDLPTLLSIVRKKSAAEEEASRHPADDFLYRRLVEELAQRIILQEKPQEARELLAMAPSWLRAGQFGDELSLLAALAADEMQIAGRTIGIVVGAEGEVDNQRSIQFAMGLMRQLRTSRGKSQELTDVQAVRLIAQERRKSTTAALGVLSGLGASILVAGFSKEDANQASSYAKEQNIPVILLEEPDASLSDYAFLASLKSSAEREFLQRRFSDMQVVEGQGDCLSFQAEEQAHERLLHWKSEGISRIALLMDAPCAQRWLGDARALGFAPEVVLGLRTTPASAFGWKAYEIRSGSFPARRNAPLELKYSSDETQPLKRGANWYSALGRDVGVLAKGALKSLSGQDATDTAKVRQVHQQLRNSLLKVEADLITTSARGFAGSQILPRQLELKELHESSE